MIYRATRYLPLSLGTVLYDLPADKLRGIRHLLEDLGGGRYRVNVRPAGVFPGDQFGMEGLPRPWEAERLEPVEAASVAAETSASPPLPPQASSEKKSRRRKR